jgi:hypothetical protein
MDTNIENVNEEAKIDTEKKFSELAIKKIANELATFKGGNKETAVSSFVAFALTHFCEQSERFATILFKTPRTLSECCAEIMSNTGNTVSDIDVYRAAVKSYFPNAEVEFTMEIALIGDAPSEEEILRPPLKKVTEPIKRKAVKNEDKPIPKTDAKVETAIKPQPKKPKTPAVKATTEKLQLSLF